MLADKLISIIYIGLERSHTPGELGGEEEGCCWERREMEMERQEQGSRKRGVYREVRNK